METYFISSRTERLRCYKTLLKDSAKLTIFSRLIFLESVPSCVTSLGVKIPTSRIKLSPLNNFTPTGLPQWRRAPSLCV